VAGATAGSSSPEKGFIPYKAQHVLYVQDGLLTSLFTKVLRSNVKILMFFLTLEHSLGAAAGAKKGFGAEGFCL
jgi:hypothetical protein